MKHEKQRYNENQDTQQARRAKNRHQPFPEFPPDGKHIRNEEALLWQECPVGALRQLDLQRIK